MQTEEHTLPQTALEVTTPECHQDEYEMVYHKPETMVDVSMQ